MYALISCGVFRDEVERVVSDLDFSVQCRYLDPGLHVDFDELSSELKRELERCRDRKIIVAYGACHPRMEELLSPYRAALLDCQNCVDALITRREVERRAEKGLYFYLSPGWLDCWRDMFRRLNWTQEEARMELGSFKGSVYLDTLGDARSREDALMEFFDYTLLTCEIMPVNLDHFKSLIIKAKNRLEE
ncbi:MAG: DUF1638 domain-containing protein [Methanosarcinales archaeon]|nr:DUF1638 domain-containing protein [Methanosarcinales archaeon]